MSTFPWCSEELLAKNLTGKVILVTGGNSGIGKSAVIQLAKQGATVVFTCRNMQAGQEAVEEAQKVAQGNQVTAMKMDLADLSTVKQFVTEFLSKFSRLDVLVNNAGVMGCPFETTKDGYEKQLQTNHIGHHLLNVLLIPILKTSAPSRIICTSSCFHDHAQGKEGMIAYDDLHFESRKYDPWTSYAQSKLANVLEAMQLSKVLRGSGVTAVALHPGWVDSNLAQYAVGSQKSCTYAMLKPILKMAGMMDTWGGAQTTLFCILDDSVTTHSGEYYSRGGIYTREKQRCKKVITPSRFDPRRHRAPYFRTSRERFLHERHAEERPPAKTDLTLCCWISINKLAPIPADFPPFPT